MECQRYKDTENWHVKHFYHQMGIAADSEIKTWSIIIKRKKKKKKTSIWKTEMKGTRQPEKWHVIQTPNILSRNQNEGQYAPKEPDFHD